MDQEPKQELSGKIQRQLLGEQVREEIAAFEEERPFSKGEYFGNLEQNFPGGNNRQYIGIDPDYDNFITAVDRVLEKTEAERQSIIKHYFGKKASKQPLVELIRDLRLRIEVKAVNTRKLTNEKRLEKAGEELNRLNTAITDLLLPPYLELRMEGYSHEKLTV